MPTCRFCLHAAAKVNMFLMQILEIFIMCKKKNTPLMIQFIYKYTRFQL